MWLQLNDSWNRQQRKSNTLFTQPSRPRRHLQSSSVVNEKQQLRREFAHFLHQQRKLLHIMQHLKCSLCPSSIFRCRWKKSSHWRVPTSNCCPSLHSWTRLLCFHVHSCAAVASGSNTASHVTAWFLLSFHTDYKACIGNEDSDTNTSEFGDCDDESTNVPIVWFKQTFCFTPMTWDDCLLSK